MADSVVLRLDSGPLVPAVTFVTDEREVGVTRYGTEVSSAEADQIRQQAKRAHLALAEGYADDGLAPVSTDIPAEVANGEAEPSPADEIPSPVVPDPEAVPTGADNERFDPVEVPHTDDQEHADEPEPEPPADEPTPELAKRAPRKEADNESPADDSGTS